MTENPGFQPDPATNRAQWLAAHPQAVQASAEQAAGEVASHLGAAAPGAGVTGEQLGQQMADAGAAAGLPHETVMDQLMAQVKAMGEQIHMLQARDQQREAAAIAALGEPILQRYANAVRDHLAATVAANPGSAEHFKTVLADAEKLSVASADAISRGANDLGQVASLASRIDRFLTRGHARTAPHTLRQVDLSTVAHHLEYLVEEAARLAPGMLALA